MKHAQSGYSQNGFTLVELAIALMVIGLLIGGILKGQEMIENARITKFIQTIKSYEAGVRTFKSTYKQLPGDMPSPSTRLANCTSAPCSVGGNDNGRIGDNAEEVVNFWEHMNRANVISPVTIETSFSNANFGVVTNVLGPGNLFVSRHGPTILGEPNGNYLVMGYMFDWPYGGGLSGKRASRIDQKMDDGVAMTGDFIGEPDFIGMMGNGEECHIIGTEDYKEDGIDDHACTTFYKLQR